MIVNTDGSFAALVTCDVLTREHLLILSCSPLYDQAVAMAAMRRDTTREVNTPDRTSFHMFDINWPDSM